MLKAAVDAVKRVTLACIQQPTTQSPLQENAATVDGTFPIDEEGRVLLKELDFEGTRDFLASIGVDEKRTVHVWRWLYRHRIKDWEQAQVQFDPSIIFDA